MKYAKILLAAVLFALYYVGICWIFGGNFGDPWERLMKWAKKESRYEKK